MNKLIGKQISWNNALLGTVLAGIGLVGLLYAPAIVSIFSLSIASYWALRLVYGKEAVKQLFGKPIAPVKTISKYFLLNILISFLVSLVLQYGLKWDLHGNPVNEGFQWLTLLVIPIILLGEELFSIFFLAIFSSKCTLPVASILSRSSLAWFITALMTTAMFSIPWSIFFSFKGWRACYLTKLPSRATRS
ncbi:hypothetical protein IGI72_000713 [Enterococcus sp. DIV1059_2]